jgi:hypothetical protein
MAGDKKRETLQTLSGLMRWIRDHASNPRHQEPLLSNSFAWHQLCAAFDAIGDTELATDAYLEGDFPQQPGERYLRVYGVLQALVVQQDAVRDMTSILCPGIPLKLVDLLKGVRDARHASIGHPTRRESKGDVSSHFISRITMSKDYFQLLSHSKKDGSSSTYVPVRKLIEQQRTETVRIMSEVVTELKRKDEEHKSLFRGKSMTGSFHTVTYAIEKIFEDLHKNTIVGMGKWGMDTLKSALDDFRKMLGERGMSVETYDSVKYHYEQIEYPLRELQKFFAGEPSEIGSYQAAMVYGDALQGYFSELRKSAQGIDEEYNEQASAVGGTNA